MEQTTFLLLILLGTLALVGGMLWTRLHWRADVPPYSRRTRFLDVTLHPERYAKGQAVPVIRTLNGAGGLGVAGALAILAYKAFRDLFTLIGP